jgi:hypothetical protein
MKTLRHLSRPTAALLGLALTSFSCNKDLPTTETLPPKTSASNDASAGNWRMLVLTGPTQITVAPPAAATSDAYKAELAAIKASQASLTDAQKENIQYWSGGGVLRWNQILRELVARYNLLAVPVVDDEGRLEGIVTVDDAMDSILPTAWKKRLPRLFARGGT